MNIQQFARFTSDPVDTTRRDLDNTRFSNYILADYQLGTPSDYHVKFATSQPAVMFSGTNGGRGLNGDVVDFESILTLKQQGERPLEKLQLFQRPFVTVPFLGKGRGDPEIESRLLQGEPTYEPKSISSTIEQSTLGNAFYVVDANMENKVKDTRYTVEESALEGWRRGGNTTRS